MNGITVERFAEYLRARERCEKWRLRGGCQGQSRDAGGRSDKAKQGKNIIRNELLGVRSCFLGLIAIIQRS